MPEENERRKIQRLKKECEKLRDKLAETTSKLKDQEKLCSTVDEKERRYASTTLSPYNSLTMIHTQVQRSVERVLGRVSGYRDQDQQSEAYASFVERIYFES